MHICLEHVRVTFGAKGLIVIFFTYHPPRLDYNGIDFGLECLVLVTDLLTQGPLIKGFAKLPTEVGLQAMMRRSNVS
ncbi:MAG TPA: hypothetical protein DD706_10265 [Nitrospiraceae bacterium]|nr:hypothetical protein [Nitrospiraceae bacterium]